MNRLFQLGDTIRVPDGTTLAEVLGPRELHLWHQPMVKNLSLAVGELPPGTHSSVHVHPIVAHAAWVLEGTLTITMKGPHDAEPYTLRVQKKECAYTEPGTFMQLINRSDAACQVLYVVAPAFVYETDGSGKVIYNDAIMLSQSWEDLRAIQWRVPQLDDIEAIRRARGESLARLSRP